MSILIKETDFTPYCTCPNDDIYCKCENCINNEINNGTCGHCITCFSGNKSIDTCDEYQMK